MKKARFIYNPTSGREEARKVIADVLETLEDMGYEASTFSTKKSGDATKEASRLCECGFDLIVVAGGDGTLNEVISGMANHKNRPKLALLPLGTTNDFARAMGIPRDIQKSLKILREEKTKKIDIGKVNDRYFINIAGGGCMTELSYEVSSKLKTAMGPMAYYLKGMEKLANIKPFDAEIEIDGKVKKEKILLFLVANTNSVGGFEKLAPKADSSDGLFDVFILKKVNLAKFTHVLGKLLTGEHLNDGKVVHFKTNNFSIKTKQPMAINVDGELGGHAPAKFELLEKHIEFISNI